MRDALCSVAVECRLALGTYATCAGAPSDVDGDERHSGQGEPDRETSGKAETHLVNGSHLLLERRTN
jgi:hypothetical protein